MTYEGLQFGVEIRPEHGSADSGDLEHDLSELFIVIAKAAVAKGTAAMLVIDEMQYIKPKDLGALMVAFALGAPSMLLILG